MDFKFTEKNIQKFLYRYCERKNHSFMVSNKYLDNWFECDFLSCTKNDYINEYEIKISKSDFKHDMKKEEKHYWLSGKMSGKVLLEGRKIPINFSDYKGPNYFWYVCPDNLIQKNEIPEYSGLIWVYQNGQSHIQKRAKMLHNNKFDDSRKLNIMKKYMYYYYQNKYS